MTCRPWRRPCSACPARPRVAIARPRSRRRFLDPGIVWDELVGYWITMIAVPAEWLWILVGFVLFRVFDIWKPWPVRIADKTLKGGFGIMIDDVLAGVYALICLHLLVWVGG